MEGKGLTTKPTKNTKDFSAGAGCKDEAERAETLLLAFSGGRAR
jgi:hypothetical protein